jgi:hypothetical protein
MEVSGSTSIDPQTLNQTLRPMEGCHVATHVWAMWHHIIRPHVCHVPNFNSSNVFLGVCPVTCHCTCHVFHVSYKCMTLPRQLYRRAMCHPCSGDTCHSLTRLYLISQSAPCLRQHANAPYHISCMTIQLV